MKKYKLAVYIGRFQPFHFGHEHCLDIALQHADRALILVGSFNRPRTTKNPWSYEERKRMIQSVSRFNEANIFIEPLNDYPNLALWEKAVQDAVSRFGYSDKDILLVGHKKDASSFYMDIFPQWHKLDTGLYPFTFKEIDGTTVRELYFEGKMPYFSGVLSPDVLTYLKEYQSTLMYSMLKEEYEYDISYTKSWAGSPFPPTFITTDAVVVQSGHLLLIRRKHAPGRGLFALPGGFLDVKQTIFDSCIRELREETGLKVPEIVLRKALVETHVFDTVGRSTRGRVVTHGHYFLLDDTKELPHIKGADDADKAVWVPLKDVGLMASELFEDHIVIIEHFIGSLS